MMSVCGIKDLIKSTPEGDFRSTAIEDLCLVRRSEVGGGSLEEDALWVRFGIDRSIRKTDAPLSASRRPANGPANCVSSNWREVEVVCRTRGKTSKLQDAKTCQGW